MHCAALPSASIGTDEIVSGKEDDFLSILNDKSYGSGPHGTDEKDDDMWSSFSDVISQVNNPLFVYFSKISIILAVSAGS